MTTSVVAQVGARFTLSKVISEADVALFALVVDAYAPAVEEPHATDPVDKSAVPDALVTALLMASAARHGGGLDAVVISRAEVSCMGSAFTGDTLIATAEVAACDTATRTLRVRAHCATQEGAQLAEGAFELRTRG